MTLREFFAVLRSRWLIVVAMTLLVAGATTAVTLAMPKSYTSFTSVYLSANGNQGAIARQDLQTYTQVLTSPDVMVPLRKAAQIPDGDGVGVAASVSETSNILNIVATAPTADEAARAATATGPALAAVAPKFTQLLAGSNATVTARTIIPAAVPSSPTSPKLNRNIALGVMVGLLLGCSAALLRHAFDTRIRRAEDLSSLSDRPLLAEIPSSKDAVNPTSLAEDAHGPAVEAMRRLRTNVRFVNITSGKNAIVVTSPAPGDGKTTTSVALALAMARDNARVLLMDCDLRRPTIADALGLEGGVGLTTVLLGQASIDDVLQRWQDSSLDVLASGELPPNPTELIGSEPMAKLFEQLVKFYDFVIIDSPPMLPVVDSIVLNQLAGNLLMVVATDRTHRRDLQTALRSLETAGTEPSGFALNYSNAADAGHYSYGYAAPTGKPTTRAGKRKKQRQR